jgi:hypothetical protein
VGDCPAVLSTEGRYVIIGKRLDPEAEGLSGKVGPGEEAVEIPAEILLSALGVTELVEAAKRADQLIADLNSLMIFYLTKSMEKDEFISEVIGRLDGPDPYVSLRSIIDRIKGGVNG